MLIKTSSQTSNVDSQREQFSPFQQQVPPTLYDNPLPKLYNRVYPKAQTLHTCRPHFLTRRSMM